MLLGHSTSCILVVDGEGHKFHISAGSAQQRTSRLRGTLATRSFNPLSSEARGFDSTINPHVILFFNGRQDKKNHSHTQKRNQKNSLRGCFFLFFSFCGNQGLQALFVREAPAAAASTTECHIPPARFSIRVERSNQFYAQ